VPQNWLMNVYIYIIYSSWVIAWIWIYITLHSIYICDSTTRVWRIARRCGLHQHPICTFRHKRTKTPRKSVPKGFKSPPLPPPTLSLVRDKGRSKLGPNEISNPNRCHVPDEQMSKWCMLKSVVNIVSFSFFSFFGGPSCALEPGPRPLKHDYIVVNPRSSSLRPH